MKLKKKLSKLFLCKRRPMQLVIQLIPTSATDHVIAVYAVKV